MKFAEKITLHNVRRIVKPIPFIGTVVVLGTAGTLIRRKGVVFGFIDLTLDILPLVGIAKGTVELFVGELIPDKKIAAENDSLNPAVSASGESEDRIERAA